MSNDPNEALADAVGGLSLSPEKREKLEKQLKDNRRLYEHYPQGDKRGKAAVWQRIYHLEIKLGLRVVKPHAKPEDKAPPPEPEQKPAPSPETKTRNLEKLGRCPRLTNTKREDKRCQNPICAQSIAELGEGNGVCGVHFKAWIRDQPDDSQVFHLEHMVDNLQRQLNWYRAYLLRNNKHMSDEDLFRLYEEAEDDDEMNLGDLFD